MPALEQAEVELTILVGSAALPLSKVMTLARGDVINLARSASGPVFIEANERLLTAAEVRLIGDRVAVEVPVKA